MEKDSPIKEAAFPWHNFTNLARRSLPSAEESAARYKELLDKGLLENG